MAQFSFITSMYNNTCCSHCTCTKYIICTWLIILSQVLAQPLYLHEQDYTVTWQAELADFSLQPPVDGCLYERVFGNLPYITNHNVEHGLDRMMVMLRIFFFFFFWGGGMGWDGRRKVDEGGKSHSHGKSSQQASQIPWCPASRPKWPTRHVYSSPPPSADAALSGPDGKRWQFAEEVNFSDSQNLIVPG